MRSGILEDEVQVGAALAGRCNGQRAGVHADAHGVDDAERRVVVAYVGDGAAGVTRRHQADDVVVAAVDRVQHAYPLLLGGLLALAGSVLSLLLVREREIDREPVPEGLPEPAAA